MLLSLLRSVQHYSSAFPRFGLFLKRNKTPLHPRYRIGIIRLTGTYSRMHSSNLPSLRKGGDSNANAGAGAGGGLRGLDRSEHGPTTPPHIALGAAWCTPSALLGHPPSVNPARTSPPLPATAAAGSSPRGASHTAASSSREGNKVRALYSQATKDEEVEEARRESTAARKKKVEELSDYLTQHAARHFPEAQRSATMRKTLEDTAALYPNLKDILLPVSRYVKEMNSSMHTMYTAQADELSRQEKELYEKYESFFEGKILEMLKEKKKAEERASQLQREVLELRRDRDEDLNSMKEDLMRRLSECEQREDEFRSFRQLITSVFQTNQELIDRMEVLEELLKKHRIPIPPIRGELYSYSKRSKAAEEDGSEGVKPIASQVPVEFIAASKDEMTHARLTLQRELLQSAFDERTAYRMQVTGFKTENTELQYKVSTLQNMVVELNRYIYERRFLSSSDQTTAPKTPRPRDVPFAIQTELGIDLRQSTSDIVAELAAVATNMKHQLNSALLRLRQSTTVAEWMDEETLLALDADYNGVGVLPTYPASLWPRIPHFLRTHITADVPNLRWSEADAGALMLELFDHYRELREECRYVRDAKMVQPRVYQLYERKQHVLTRFDATKADVSTSEANVPFGYVVSHFINKYLLGIDAGTQSTVKTPNPVILPGTLQPRFTVRGEQRVVELESTRFAYNLWWAAQRYADTEPLCRLFLALTNGTMPLETYDVMKSVLLAVERHVAHWDVSGGRSLSYGQLVAGSLQLVQDMGAQAGRGVVFACAQTFEETGAPITGGRIPTAALLADEACVLPAPTSAGRRPPSASGAKASASAHTSMTEPPGDAGRKLPPAITARRVPERRTAVGASVFVRYWRRLVLARYERVFRLVERVLAPLVRESEMVRDLYLLSVPDAYARLGCYDEDAAAKDAEARRAATDMPVFEDDAVLSVTAAEEEEGEGSVAYMTLPEVNKDYVTLMKDSLALVQRRRAAEQALLSVVGRAVLEGLPRLNRSVHFPFDAVVEEVAEPANATAGARRRPRSNRGRPGQPSASGEKDKKAASPGKRRGRSPAAERGGKKEKAEKAPLPPADSTGNPAASPSSAPAPRAVSAGAAAASTRVAQGTASVLEGLSEDLFINPDKEMVEWFGFCNALRSKLPALSDALFQNYIKGTTAQDGKDHVALDDAVASASAAVPQDDAAPPKETSADPTTELLNVAATEQNGDANGSI
ncbi:hypothetical protein STCU_06186 [Strigomonas culicis]|uniref:Uncharacterized protein n=1 Tax=Strigomonas culicis TaxID=28005 RepID=S9VTI8_9TRYP|nr:hypothetical protein STCU_06186 [Strigomonas culicis]|eukprot:EPY26575.1 hypothetical protein STCU_06186 [Strigomonas culicis]